MKLKFIYSCLGYLISAWFVFLMISIVIGGYSISIDYTLKGVFHIGLLGLSGSIFYSIVKIPKEIINLQSLFSLFGKLTIVIILAYCFDGYKSLKDKALIKSIGKITNTYSEASARLASCEKTFKTYENKKAGVVDLVRETCGKMIIDIVKTNPLNVKPALDLVARLENNKKSEKYFTSIKVCLTAESGQVESAVQMATQGNLSYTLKALKETGHCKVFLKRNIDNEQ